MPKASIKRLIECKKTDLINLVLDIEKYPEFVPFCYNAKIYEKEESDTLTKIIADLTIGRGPFKDTYKSDVLYNKQECSIHVKNIDGPLNHLSNKWLFNEHNNVTEVIFDIDFDGEEEIIIGRVAGERFVHEYQIYEIRQGDKGIEAVPSISFRGNAEIDREKRTLVNRHKSGGVCILTIDTYVSNGKGFEMVERIELDRDFDNHESDCIKKIYRQSGNRDLELVN